MVFTGVLSVLFLKRRLYPFHWTAMALIVAGVATVGLVSIYAGDCPSSSNETSDMAVRQHSERDRA